MSETPTRKSTRARKATKVLEESAEDVEAFEEEDEEVVDEDDDEDVTEKKGKKRKAPARKAQTTPKKAKGKEKEDVSTASAPQVTDFTVPAKLPNQIKIASWNVAGFRSILKKGLVEYVAAEDPDIICLQETKMEEELALKQKLPANYHAYFYAAHKKGYSGTGLLTKIKPISVTKGIGIDEHDTEGRTITAEYDKFYLVTSYVPNSGAALANLTYRVERWDVDFLKYLKKLEETKPVIWCGDLNVAHLEIDLKNPKTNTKTAGFTKEERDSFTKLLGNGFVDTFRHFNPSLEGAYTFWSYKAGARAKDVGWRLDYFIVSQSFLPNIASTHIRKHVAGSDHCPIILLVNN